MTFLQPPPHRTVDFHIPLPTPQEQQMLSDMAAVSPPGRNILLYRPSMSTLTTFASCARHGWVEEVRRTSAGVHVWRLTRFGVALAFPQ